MDWDEMMMGVFAVFGVFVIILFILGVCIYLPVQLYTDAECLREGYPESRITVGMERYCMNLDGSVTVRVDKQ